MIDLCGGALSTFVLGELRPVISRHPRFRANDGTTLTAFSNLIAYNDVSLVIGNLRASGDQQSPDAFMATIQGRAVAAQVGLCPGAFVEWLHEVDATHATPAPGIYYISIDAVDPATNSVRGILETNRWMSGVVAVGKGSPVYIDPRVPTYLVAPQDPNVQFRTGVGCLYILSYTANLVLVRTDTGAVLQPGLDWWVQTWQSYTLIQNTRGGVEGSLDIPENCVSFVLVDQNGFQLREGRDWDWQNFHQIALASWTAPGQTISLQGYFRMDPTTTSYVNPENVLDVHKAPDEVVVADGSSYYLQRGDFTGTDLIWNTDGSMTLMNLMDVGDRLKWEVRIQEPQVYLDFKKMTRNTGMLPGLHIAVGDRVEVGDKIAIVVFPELCDTYNVYGAKDSVSFDITIKANDLMTASELAGLVSSYLRVEGRARLENCGLTIQRVASSYAGEAKDQSGTTASHSVIVSVSAYADWETHNPLINRVTHIDLSGVGMVNGNLNQPLYLLTEVSAFNLTTLYRTPAPVPAPVYPPTLSVKLGINGNPPQYQLVTYTAYTSDPSGGPTTVTWNFGDGTPIQTGNVVDHAFDAVIETVVVVTATDARGMTSTKSFPLQVQAVTLPPVAAVVTQDTTLFQNVPTVFTASATCPTPGDNIARFTWDFGDGFADVTSAPDPGTGPVWTTSISHAFPVNFTGSAKVTVQATDVHGISGNWSAPITVTVKAPEPPVLSWLSPVPSDQFTAVVGDPGVQVTYVLSATNPNSLPTDPTQFIPLANVVFDLGDPDAELVSGTDNGDGTYTVVVAYLPTPTSGVRVAQPHFSVTDYHGVRSASPNLPVILTTTNPTVNPTSGGSTPDILGGQ